VLATIPGAKRCAEVSEHAPRLRRRAPAAVVAVPQVGGSIEKIRARWIDARNHGTTMAARLRASGLGPTRFGCLDKTA